MTAINDEEQHMAIHMKMLAKSDSAKNLGELTVVPLGFAVDIAESLIASHDREIEKAYGGCHNCYGKGYATRQDFVTGGGKKWKTSPIKYCECPRGKQLEAVISELKSEEKESYEQAIYRKANRAFCLANWIWRLTDRPDDWEVSMTDTSQLREQIDSIVERFRKAGISDSGDEFYSDDAVDALVGLFQSHHQQELKRAIANELDDYKRTLQKDAGGLDYINWLNEVDRRIVALRVAALNNKEGGNHE